MTELLTAAQMRAIETAAIESGEVTGLELMERAGRGVVEAIFEEWPELAKTAHRAVVLCGPGNNGGDGFVVARLLKDWGWEVEVFLYGDAEKLPPDARVNYERWAEMGEVCTLTESAFREAHPTYCNAYADIYVDALFGTGLGRALEGDAYDVIHHMSGAHGDDYGRRTVAVDAPSGLCLDSGRVLAAELDEKLKELLTLHGNKPVGLQPFSGGFAALTVAFDLPKVGHFVAMGPEACGKVVIKDIGLHDWRCFKKTAENQPQFKRTRHGIVGAPRLISTRLTVRFPIVKDRRRNEFPLSLFALNKLSATTHKYSHGHALILSGGAGKSGAARLAARGALRIGAGLVTLGVPHEAQAEVASQITALMMREVGDAGALAKTLEDPRFNALCLGPGLGLETARDLVPVALASGRPTVLDADALSAFADDPSALFAVLHDACVLTPHEGEFKRLFPDIHAKLSEVPTKGPAFSKVDATREAAKRAGCVVLFKGPDTVISDPSGQCSINSAHYERAAPWLATAGSGDVLAGFITGLLARGLQPVQATETAAWLHVECARAFGPGLIAEDLPEMLPKVFKQLES